MNKSNKPSETVTITPLTRELCRDFFREFVNDPALFADGLCPPHVYSEAAADRYFERKSGTDRRMFSILLDGRVIGEVSLKHLDLARGEGELSICLQNDSVKGRGYGTQAERLLLEYAFGTLGLHAVTAECLQTNLRSCHVVEKLGFCEIGRADGMVRYRLERSAAAF